MPDPVPFMAPEQIEARADEVLRRHGLFSVPVDPVKLANREGIKVHNATFNEDSLSGMIAKRGPDITILVNQNDPPFRKRFTIAHELGHHFLHLMHDGDFVDKKVDLFRGTETPETVGMTPERRAEIQANQFAAGLLMPAEFVRQEYARTPDLSELARKFNVSEAAMGFRLSRLGLV